MSVSTPASRPTSRCPAVAPPEPCGRRFRAYAGLQSKRSRYKCPPLTATTPADRKVRAERLPVVWATVRSAYLLLTAEYRRPVGSGPAFALRYGGRTTRYADPR